jgi:CheY-like chemotaxis protein
MRILVVDDDPLIGDSEFLRNLYTATGAKIDICRTHSATERWIEDYEASDLALALVDVRLPGDRDGWDVVDLLNKSVDTAGVPVIVRTAFPGEDYGMAAAGKIAALVDKLDDNKSLGMVRSLLHESNHPLPPWPPPQSLLQRMETSLQRISGIVGGIRTVIGALVGIALALLGTSFARGQAQEATVTVIARSGTQLHDWPGDGAPQVGEVRSGELVEVVCLTAIEGEVWLYSQERGWIHNVNIDLPASVEYSRPIPPC